MTVNGNSYIFNFAYIFHDKMNLDIERALERDMSENFLDYYNYQIIYSKDGVDGKLFCRYEGDDYEINLPDGHTVDEIVYFARSNSCLMVFDNGDVYKWKLNVSVIADEPVKDEELTALSGDIEGIYLCGTVYRLLMSDGAVYSLDYGTDY